MYFIRFNSSNSSEDICQVNPLTLPRINPSMFKLVSIYKILFGLLIAINQY